MFKKNPDAMRMEPTPERVLAVCRVIANSSMTHDELRDIMTLGKMDEKAIDLTNKSIAVALEELNMLRTKNECIELAVDEEILKSDVTFRRYVASRVLTQKDTTFYMFTKWLIAQNVKLFDMKNWEVMGANCKKEINELSKLNENAVLGWRFWAAFLGEGYLSGTMFIPNMKTRIQDKLATSFSQKFKYGETIRADDFMNWFSVHIPEVETVNNTLPLAASAGLRTLHNLDLIHFETWRDSTPIRLYEVEGEINTFSHITVKEDVCK